MPEINLEKNNKSAKEKKIKIEMCYFLSIPTSLLLLIIIFQNIYRIFLGQGYILNQAISLFGPHKYIAKKHKKMTNIEMLDDPELITLHTSFVSGIQY